MVLRMAAASVFLFAANCTANAERRQPAEKFSPKLVQREQSFAQAPPGFVHSAWVKFCGKDKTKSHAKDICLTAKEARLETGQFAAGAALIEGAGDKTVLRVTLPVRARRMASARVAIDGDKPRSGKFVSCSSRGCFADFEVSAEFLARLKAGDALYLHGIGDAGQTMSYRLPLDGFAQANEGPSSAPPQN